MIDIETFTLIKELFSKSFSPKDCLHIIQSYFDKNLDFANKEQFNQYIKFKSFAEEIIKNKRQQGLNAVAKRTTTAKKQTEKQYDKPGFIENFKGQGHCACCKVSINGQIDCNGNNTRIRAEQVGVEAFWWNKEKKIYCTSPSCFPASFKEYMMNNPKYMLYLNKNHKIMLETNGISTHNTTLNMEDENSEEIDLIEYEEPENFFKME